MRDAQHDEENTYATLTKILLRRMPEPGHYPTDIPGLVLHRRDIPNQPENCFNKPILAVTVQGSKRTVVGTQEYRYGAGHCLLAGVDMPSMSYLIDVSPEKPYLVMSLDLDSRLISQLTAQLTTQITAQSQAQTMHAGQPKITADKQINSQAHSQTTMQANSQANRHAGSGCNESSPTPPHSGTAVTPTDPDVLKAFHRLVLLLDKPEQIPVLAPIIVSEIHLLLLLGPAGNLLKAINTQGNRSNQVLCGINLLRETFKSPLDVEGLAKAVHMAPPTFRKHFKAVTTMNPTQYHKRLRLYEAQRLMLEDHKDVSNASLAVGYESLSQFNREYKRLFGEPPARSVSRLR